MTDHPVKVGTKENNVAKEAAKVAVEPAAGLYEALRRAQATMPAALINKTNPHFKNRYADLAAVREAAIPILSDLGCAVTQTMAWDAAGRYGLVTRITHAATGEHIESVLPLPDTGKPQEIGAAITYMRRYGLATLAGLTSEEDDDGNTAGTVAKKEPERTISKGVLSPTSSPTTPTGKKLPTDMTIADLRVAYKTAIDDIEAAEGDPELVRLTIVAKTPVMEQMIRRNRDWWDHPDEPEKGFKGRVLSVIYATENQKAVKMKDIIDHIEKLERVNNTAAAA